ncbi:hypothetical protein KK083_10445 [Fulvivirgaceae bacterium PWU4]|uniref:Uncharacterized protein n=1 Tax=Chryseosolibacter histidini TaxID=2782349 RepID=A0AAP2GPD4_9BACT|nr:hypothetical protein [Chryseosolibacter histidini]MBT1697297.1 hypothetical protein [Chryseosolibacter histidini]
MKPKIALVLTAIVMIGWSCESRYDQKGPETEKQPALKEASVTEIEPDNDLLQAENKFIQGDYTTSASHLEAAAEAMRQIAESLKGKHKNRIESSASDIDALADEVAHNKIKDLGSLNPVIAKAGQALAGYRLELTENEFFTVSEAQAGATLKKTIEQLEKSVVSHHRALDPVEKTVLDHATDIASRLRKGDKLTTEDLKATLQSVDHEIEKWQHELDNANR